MARVKVCRLCGVHNGPRRIVLHRMRHVAGRRRGGGRERDRAFCGLPRRRRESAADVPDSAGGDGVPPAAPAGAEGQTTREPPVAQCTLRFPWGRVPVAGTTGHRPRGGILARQPANRCLSDRLKATRRRRPDPGSMDGSGLALHQRHLCQRRAASRRRDPIHRQWRSRRFFAGGCRLRSRLAGAAPVATNADAARSEAGLVLDVTAVTHQGKVRQHNEDTIVVDRWICGDSMSTPRRSVHEFAEQTDSALLLVADGMGGPCGRPGGESARGASDGPDHFGRRRSNRSRRCLARGQPRAVRRPPLPNRRSGAWAPPSPGSW